MPPGVKGDLVRLLATIVLLVIVLRHAHWSVAACLTLSAISAELGFRELAKIRAELRRRRLRDRGWGYGGE